MKNIYVKAMARAFECARLHHIAGYIKGEAEMMKIFHFCLSRLMK